MANCCVSEKDNIKVFNSEDIITDHCDSKEISLIGNQNLMSHFVRWDVSFLFIADYQILMNNIKGKSFSVDH